MEEIEEIEKVLKEIIEFFEYKIPDNKYNLTMDDIIFYLIEDYSLTKVFKGNTYMLSKFLSDLFPNRPKTRNNIKQWLLSLAYLRLCPKCKKVLPIENFDINSNKCGGLNAYCKKCNLIVHGKAYYSNYSAKRKALKLLRTPKFANLLKIKEFYRQCPEGYEVDHIIPLQGNLVSGLHVESNLQYLTKSENSRKSNKWEVS